MNLTPGELYFVRETDYLTNKLTNYIKIGLIKDKEGRTSESRAAEHQTGNPRTLSVYKVITTPAISEVENIVHKLYATHRIEGEWFHFTDAELAKAIKTATELAAEIKASIKTVEAAQKYKTSLSTEKIVKPTAKLKEFYQAYQIANLKFKRCKDLLDQYKATIKEAVEKGEDVAGVAKVKEVKDRVDLDLKALEEKYPQLWGNFLVTTSRLASSFRWAKYEGPELSLKAIDKPLFTLTEEFAALLASKSKTATSLIHEKHLVLLAHQARAELDKEIAAANIQVGCKDAKAIEGICTWKRETKSETNFDVEAFTQAHPKIAQQLSRVKKQKAAVAVKPKRGQKVS
ncbi:MAG: GIY-YIG nuclease family protein [Actinomycetes bacterium]